ncbi:MAG TPA: RHS repeat domain-containing protein [Kofleriaceae bacterium]|nr:RHS repeat domain-containing protein [Kofleriaceae bacterium]
MRYAYDPLGRLVQAATADGDAVQYAYDAAGNITSIHRLAAGALRVVDFTPPGGTVGTTVGVFGAGFSTTASQNTVTFNGTAAMVTAATATTLTVSVPAGATTGQIAVATTAGTALSTSNFMVLSSSTAPGIAGFTPPVATQGTVIAVTGVNFQVRAQDNRVSVGGQLADLVRDGSSPTSTLLKFTVPSTTASGKIEVATPYGSAISNAELFVLPAAVSPTDVEAAGRVAVNGVALGLTTTTAGKKLVLVFDALAGQRLHLVATGGTFAGPFSADLYGSSPTKLQTLTMNDNSVGDLATPIAASGPYTVVLNPGATDKGTVQLSVIDDATGSLAIDGNTPMTLRAGQNARMSFTAQAGSGYGLAVTSLGFTPSTGSPTMSATLRKPDGTALASCVFSAASSCDLDAGNFATAGTYLVDFDPSGLAAASFNVLLSSEATGAMAIDASSPTTITITRAGQNARYSFSGTAGQRVTAVITADTIDDGNPTTTSSTQVAVYPPSNPTAAVASGSVNPIAPAGTVDMMLPETGTYTLMIRPSGLDTGTVNVQLKSYGSGTLAVNGSTAINLGAGQNARYGFTAQASTGYGLALVGLGFTPNTGSPSPSMAVTVRNATGTAVASCSFTASGSCDLEPASFASAGTYVLEFDPNGVYAASFSALLSSDLTGTVAIGGPPTVVTTTQAGQNARYSMSGAAGQSISIVFSGSTIDDGNPSTSSNNQVVLLRPNGAVLASTSFNSVANGAALDVVLPDTGSYTIALKPSGLDCGSVNLKVVALATGTLTVDGTTAVSLDAGQNGRYSFTAQAGSGYGLALANLSFTPSTATPPPAIAVALLKADGSSLATCSFTASNSCDFGSSNFATAGTYTLAFDPNGTVAASFNAVLSTDAQGSVTIDAAPAAVTIARAGQNARYTFSGTAGQPVKLVITGSTLDDGNPATSNTTQIAVFKPSSATSAMTTAGLGTGIAGLTMNLTLPETGTYSIAIDPTGLDSGSLNLGVTHQ